MPGNGTSSLSDVVITVVLGDIYGLPTTIRSVRTAGVGSTLVVLADSQAATIIKNSISHIISSCGVLVIDVGTIDESQIGPSWRVKWHLAADFLKVTPYHFQRFIFVDGSDTFFQGDPFISNVDPGCLYFASEAGKLIVSQLPKNWVTAFSGAFENRTFDHPALATSPILGGVRPFLAFCTLLLRLRGWAKSVAPIAEQLAISLAIWSGFASQARIVYHIIPFCGFSASVSLLDKRYGPVYDTNNYITCPGSLTTPSVISHYITQTRSIGAQIRGLCAAGEIDWAFKIEPVR
jgi:hypothetical protein